MDAHRLSQNALFVALALILGYVESLLPTIGIPGMKIGLPNLVIVMLLMRDSFHDALMVNLLRIFLNALLFGNIYSFLFSLAGGLLSLCFMAFFHHHDFHLYTVSIVGGVSHNVAQIFVAMLLTSTTALLTYLPLLMISGFLCGLLNGLIAKVLIRYLPKQGC